MIDGLEAVEISLSKLKEQNEEFRIDSEFLLKEYLLYDKRINDIGYDFIDDFSFVTDGIHESIDFDDSSQINLLSAKSPKNNVFNLSGNGYISKRQHKANPRTALKENDIIISTVGTIGNCAVVDESILPANCDRHVGIIRVEKKYRPHYLSTFLLTKYGKTQSLRHSTGNVQLNLFIYKIRNLKVAFFNDNFQKVIEDTVLKAHERIKQSNALYTSAQNLLLSHLGLADFTPTNEGVSVKTFANSFGKTGRLDSEYYQPKYDKIENVIRNYANSFVFLNDYINKYSTGFPYKSEDYIVNGEINLIRINNISNGNLDISNSATLSKKIANLSPKDFVEIGDVLISMSGTIGSSCPIMENIGAVINQRIFKITPQNINPLVLSLFINSPLGYYQLERIGTGGVQTNISGNDIKNILVPCLIETIQQEIADKVQESFSLRKKSDVLLETAKQAVEVAIEHGEVAGIDFLNRIERL